MEVLKKFDLLRILALYNYLFLPNIITLCSHFPERCILHNKKVSHNLVDVTCMGKHSLVVKLDLPS